MAHFAQLDQNNTVTQMIVVITQDVVDFTGVTEITLRKL
jgi:hypothetical protein